MKLSVISLLVAGAGLAFEQVGASPIRVVVVTSPQEMAKATMPMRLGHAAGNTNISDHLDIAQLVQPGSMSASTLTGVHVEGASKPQHLCAKLREKALNISNGLRKAFGLPEIERPHHMHGGMVQIMPFIGTPNAPHVDAQSITLAEESEQSGEIQTRPVLPMNVGHHHHHPGPSRACHRAPFLRRIHRALMTLGPWEGRTVAFVLGCGIGVLLRMIWVMTVVIARFIRGRREEQSEYHLVFEQDAEEILVPPPQYTDEKVEAVDVKMDQTAAPASSN